MTSGEQAGLSSPSGGWSRSPLPGGRERDPAMAMPFLTAEHGPVLSGPSLGRVSCRALFDLPE
eukprot:5639236-Alexandrium_andersonii.AAC.1